MAKKQMEEHDPHLRHPDDHGKSHLAHAMDHLHEHRTAEHHDVEQHADRMQSDKAGGGRDDADPRGIREAASEKGGLERGDGIEEAKGVAGRAKIWDEGDKNQPHPHSSVDKPGV